MKLGIGLSLANQRFVGGDRTPPNKMIIKSFELTNDKTPPNKMIIISINLKYGT
jgi:hypothetical protein